MDRGRGSVAFAGPGGAPGAASGGPRTADRAGRGAAHAPRAAATPGAALVVHDLKNALGALEGALEQLVRAPAREAAASAHRQCVLLRQRLVMYLTLYGRDAALRAHCEDESPAELLAAVQRRHADAAPGLTLTVAGSDAAPAFWYLDRHLVELALDAAVHNAQRYARSRVVLSATEEGGELVLAVEDDGPGLGAADPAPSAGTGLGTALCRAVAAAHGSTRPDGGVVLCNRPQGGARFALVLPT